MTVKRKATILRLAEAGSGSSDYSSEMQPFRTLSTRSGS